MSLHEAVEIVPVHAAGLTAAAQVTLRHHANLVAIRHQQRPIVIDPVILIVSAKFRVQRTPHHAHRSRQLVVRPETHLLQLHAQFLTRRLPFQFEATGTTQAAVVSDC